MCFLREISRFAMARVFLFVCCMSVFVDRGGTREFLFLLSFMGHFTFPLFEMGGHPLPLPLPLLLPNLNPLPSFFFPGKISPRKFVPLSCLGGEIAVVRKIARAAFFVCWGVSENWSKLLYCTATRVRFNLLFCHLRQGKFTVPLGDIDVTVGG